MPKIKCEDPWSCVYCDKKFQKNKGYEKLKLLQFADPQSRNKVRNTRNAETDLYTNNKLWFDHLLSVPGNVVIDGRCPKSTCVFCLIYKSELYDFNNRSSYSYHNKKNCPFKEEKLKSFANKYAYYNKQQNLLLEEEIENEKKIEKSIIENQKLNDQKKYEEEEKLRSEEDFRLRARLYDEPKPRSQASIDREKSYKKCPDEKAIDIAQQ